MNQPLLIVKQKDLVGENIQKQFSDFLYNFKTSVTRSTYLIGDDNNMKIDEETIFPYRIQARKCLENNTKTIQINMQHFYDYDKTYELRIAITSEFYRFLPFLERAVKELMEKVNNEWAKDKRFFFAFNHAPYNKRIRQLRSCEIGKLISIDGTITRSSDVKPELISGSFICKMCNAVVREVEQQFRYTEPKVCSNPHCNNHSKWKLAEEDSTFSNWQKLRVQESPSDIPTGSMPRSIDVILRNDLVESCKPGDKCSFIGELMVVPDITSLYKPGEKVQGQVKREAVRKEEQKVSEGVTGLKNLGIKDMTYKLIFVANNIIFPDRVGGVKEIGGNDEESLKHHQQQGQGHYYETKDQFSAIEMDKILEMKNDVSIYSNLAKTISPSVYGHDEVKKGILLMLFGGVNKQTQEGIKLRGDINICLVGDPSTAKSQFLKYVCQLIPRAVYTSGKGSTAAGLTAGVVKDSETGEFCIEVGALMLADNGICCIDEFDKMDLKDQVAIHEAMEQQTISIAKAGIQATLMTRTSILAASNPVFGRYDKTKSLKMNIDISAPIMSRFDLFFIIVDECNEYTDLSIAQHIINLQKNGFVDEENSKAIYSQSDILLYLKYAKNFKPQFTKEAAAELREEYKKLRNADISSQKTSYRITVRQLESLIRLSEALAKVHLEEKITPLFVREASRLLKTSIIRVDMPNVNLDFESELRKERGMDDNEGIVTGPEYEKMKTGIVYIIKQCTANNVKATYKNVISWYLEQKFESLESVKSVDMLSMKLGSVIDRLIEKEGIVIAMQDTEDPNQTVLSINVNYDAPLFDS